MPHLILASSSPQRQGLLEGLGIPFDVVPSEVEEALCTERDPAVRAGVLARMKAEDVYKKRPKDWVLGCDTLVVSKEGSLLEKPVDEEHAREMLERLSGGESFVHSGLCLIASGVKAHEGVSTSRVTFKPLSKQDLNWWISTGLWKDRSGAFQIEGPGQFLIEHLEGDWTGVVGLPVSLFGRLMREAGVSW